MSGFEVQYVEPDEGNQVGGREEEREDAVDLGRGEKVKVALLDSASSLRLVLERGALSESKEITKLKQANRRLKTEVSELQHAVGNATLARRFKELQQDREEQDKVIAALRKVISMNAIPESQVEKTMMSDVFKGAERTFGSSREQLKEEIKKLRNKSSHMHLTTRTLQTGALGTTKGGDVAETLTDVRGVVEALEGLAWSQPWSQLDDKPEQLEEQQEVVPPPATLENLQDSAAQLASHMSATLAGLQRQLEEQLHAVGEEARSNRGVQRGDLDSAIRGVAKTAAEEVAQQFKDHQAVSSVAEAERRESALLLRLSELLSLHQSKAEAMLQTAISLQNEQLEGERKSQEGVRESMAKEMLSLREDLLKAEAQLQISQQRMEAMDAITRADQERQTAMLRQSEVKLEETQRALQVALEEERVKSAAVCEEKVKAAVQQTREEAERTLQHQLEVQAKQAILEEQRLRSEVEAAKTELGLKTKEVEVLKEELRLRGRLEDGTAAITREFERMQRKLLARKVDGIVVANQEASELRAKLAVLEAQIQDGSQVKIRKSVKARQEPRQRYSDTVDQSNHLQENSTDGDCMQYHEESSNVDVLDGFDGNLEDQDLVETASPSISMNLNSSRSQPGDDEGESNASTDFEQLIEDSHRIQQMLTTCLNIDYRKKC